MLCLPAPGPGMAYSLVARLRAVRQWQSGLIPGRGALRLAVGPTESPGLDQGMKRPVRVADHSLPLRPML
jgi:hypothetical protein